MNCKKSVLLSRIMPSVSLTLMLSLTSVSPLMAQSGVNIRINGGDFNLGIDLIEKVIPRRRHNRNYDSRRVLILREVRVPQIENYRIGGRRSIPVLKDYRTEAVWVPATIYRVDGDWCLKDGQGRFFSIRNLPESRIIDLRR